ncbi:MAG: esterase family protein [Chitinophagaceae bacterium]|nr:MAG: esterase family protein [Chitinophagaceae bacterium]
MRTLCSILLITCSALFSFAGTADTVAIASKAMGRSYKAVVIKPENYGQAGKRFETVYLLHGHGGNFSNWVKLVPQLKNYADDYQLIIVCPEGKTAGWYINSHIADSMQFETYIAKEVPAFIDTNYNTVANRNGRAITGLSMGGHGGMYLGFKNQSMFSACGSMSGALLIHKITDKRYGIDKLLGDTSATDVWYNHSVLKFLEAGRKDSIEVIMDCGTEDFLIEMSRTVHNRMLELKLPHDYIERPGRHDWNYWRNAVQYQLLFFRNHFNKLKAS